MLRKRLGEILLENNLITREQLQECLDQQKFTRQYLGTVLLEKRLISQDVLMKTLSQQFDIPYVSLKNLYVDWNVCLKFSSVIMAGQNALPIRQDDTSITVAISDPLDVICVSKIEELARPKKLKLALVTQKELDDFISECKKRSKAALKDLLDKE